VETVGEPKNIALDRKLLWLVVLFILAGIYIQAESCLLVLDDTSSENCYSLYGLNGILLLLISYCAEVFHHLQPFPVLSVSIDD